jgi:hypothetical protein
LNLNSERDLFSDVSTTFLKFKALDAERIEIVLWDYRFPNPVYVGMVMNLDGSDFEPVDLEMVIGTLAVNMANQVMAIATRN